MKKLSVIFLIGWGCLAALFLQAQKRVSHDFQYHRDASVEGKLRPITQVSYPNTTSIRLYFEDIQLGENSYLLLEGSDGAQQKLDAKALQNWRNSSAYFNGDRVKVSVFEAPGDSVTFKIKELKVSERIKDKVVGQVSQDWKSTNRTTADTRATGNETDQEELPSFAKAVGRITNGSDISGFNGWIAANGAIVTAYEFSGNATIEVSTSTIYDGFDIIEFNMPSSNPDGTINHPDPEDQYPLDPDGVLRYIIEGNIANDEIWLRDYFSIKPINGIYKNPTVAGYSIVEALPNSTGLRPGERIGEYFQVSSHPTGPTMEAISTPLQIFHCGRSINSTTENYTLQQWTGDALNPRDWLTRVNNKDRFIIFDRKSSRDSHTDSWLGAPIVYAGTNLAIGIHTTEGLWGTGSNSSLKYHEFGTGFRDGLLRKYLSEFFSSEMTYVDQSSSWFTETGDIDKPYVTITDGAQNTADGGILSIAKGHYNENIIIDRPMTLQAPVGKVAIGALGGQNSRIAQVSLPPRLFADEAGNAIGKWEEDLTQKISFQSYPNPFIDRTELHFLLQKEMSVSLKVFDLLGNEIRTLVQDRIPEGAHTIIWDGSDNNGRSALPGIYIMKFQKGTDIKSVKVMKK